MTDAVKKSDALATVAGSAAMAITPLGAVSVTSAVTGVSGGAAIMQTLAISGAVVGGGALAGITVLGAGSVLIGFCVAKAVKKYKKNSEGNGSADEDDES